MLTIQAVESAILEGLTDEDMTAAELHRWLLTDMHPGISLRDTEFALTSLLRKGRIREYAMTGTDEGTSTLFAKVRP